MNCSFDAVAVPVAAVVVAAAADSTVGHGDAYWTGKTPSAHWHTAHNTRSTSLASDSDCRECWALSPNCTWPYSSAG